MKRILITSLSLSLALVLIVACTQASPTATQAPPTIEETTEEPPTATLPPTATEVEETDAPATEIPTEAPAEEETEAIEAAEDVEALIVDRCSECHSADRVFNANKTASEWDATIDRMIDYGANVNEEEKNRMIEWLISRDE